MLFVAALNAVVRNGGAAILWVRIIQRQQPSIKKCRIFIYPHRSDCHFTVWNMQAILSHLGFWLAIYIYLKKHMCVLSQMMLSSLYSTLVLGFQVMIYLPLVCSLTLHPIDNVEDT